MAWRARTPWRSGAGTIVELLRVRPRLAPAATKPYSRLAVSVAQQYLLAGLLDELRLNVVAVLLGGVIRLFDNFDGRRYNLERTLVVEPEDVTHLRYRVVK